MEWWWGISRSSARFSEKRIHVCNVYLEENAAHVFCRLLSSIRTDHADKRYPLSTASTPALRSTQPKDKASGTSSWPPPPPSAEVKNAENYNCTHPHFFMEQCLSTRPLLLSTPPTLHPQISRVHRLRQGCTNFKKSGSHLQILDAKWWHEARYWEPTNMC